MTGALVTDEFRFHELTVICVINYEFCDDK